APSPWAVPPTGRGSGTRSGPTRRLRTGCSPRPTAGGTPPPPPPTRGEGASPTDPARTAAPCRPGTGNPPGPPGTPRARGGLGRPVVSLRLVDPRFYHLDVALAPVDDANVAYYPEAFAPASRRVLRRLFPDAVIADEADALAFGLNLVSDGRNVVLNSAATGL